MRIADLIAALQSGQDPSAAVIQASAPGPNLVGDGAPAEVAAANPGIRPEFLQSGFMPPLPGATPPGMSANAQATPPPQTSAPVGAKTPITNPQPAAEAPKAYQSPPDLTNLYLESLKKSQNAAALDSGLTMIAAGLTPNLSTRAALINQSGQGGQGRAAPTAADLINLQKAQADQKNMLLRQSMLGSLAKQYNFTPETIQYLEASGKLDEVIKHHNTQNLTVVEAPDGSKAFWDHRGNKMVDIPGVKPPKTTWVDGPKGKELRRDDTGEIIGSPLGAPRKTQIAKSETTGREVLIDSDTGEEIRELVPARKPGEKVGEDDDRLAAINKDRAAAGQPPMNMETYLKDVKRSPGTQIYLSQDGVQYPAPPAGWDYERNPDGKVKIIDGKPKLYATSPKEEAATAKTAAEASLEQKKLEEAQKKEARQKVAQIFTASNVGTAVDRALTLAEKPGASGFGAKWSRAISPGGLPSDDIDAALGTIKSNTALAALAEMRAASPTGGALGSVTDFEQKMLSETIANVNPNQSTAQLKNNLIRVKAAMLVMAEKSYKTENAAEFEKDLKDKIGELSRETINRGGSVKIEKVN